MFSYQMVSTEINQILDQASLLKSAAYEALVFSQQGKEEMCSHKINDLERILKETQKQIKELNQKIEYINSQG